MQCNMVCRQTVVVSMYVLLFAKDVVSSTRSKSCHEQCDTLMHFFLLLLLLSHE